MDDAAALAGRIDKFRLSLQAAGSLAYMPDWPARSRALRSYLKEVPPGSALVDLPAIESALFDEWRLPVVRIHGSPADRIPAGQFHPARLEARYLGRFSMRRLAFTNPGDGYIAVDADQYPKRGLWMLLHELAHIALHCDTLLTFTEAYRAICKAPADEQEVWAKVSARMHPVRMEAEADLLAARWLLLGISDDKADHALSPMGRTIVEIERAVSGCEFMNLTPRGAAEINLAAEEQQAAYFRKPYPATGRVLQRAIWAAVNMGDETALEAIDSPLSDVAHSSPVLKRLLSTEFEGALAADHWDPFVVLPPDGRLPAYYIPIASIPRPGSDVSDLELSWRHLMKSVPGPGRPLREWIKRAAQADAGLMVFARTPAERVLDREGRFRF